MAGAGRTPDNGPHRAAGAGRTPDNKLNRRECLFFGYFVHIRVEAVPVTPNDVRFLVPFPARQSQSCVCHEPPAWRRIRQTATRQSLI